MQVTVDVDPDQVWDMLSTVNRQTAILQNIARDPFRCGRHIAEDISNFRHLQGLLADLERRMKGPAQHASQTNPHHDGSPERHGPAVLAPRQTGQPQP